MDVGLRLATVDDAEAIAEIYNREVVESTATFDMVPRSVAEQRAWLAARSGAYPAVVAHLNDGVVGFGALSPYRDRPAYSTSVEDSVYVHPAHQRHGIGRALLNELITVAVDHGFHAVFARIVDEHLGSIALHRAAGFEVVGTEREVGRKFGRWLDVIVMERLL
jgi:L-amino acid N-acyltransferase